MPEKILHEEESMGSIVRVEGTYMLQIPFRAREIILAEKNMETENWG